MTSQRMRPGGPKRNDRPPAWCWVLAGTVRALLLGLLWVLLSGADPSYAAYGIASAAGAAAFSLALAPPRGRPRPRSWVRRTTAAAHLAVWFVGKSVYGGVDVAVRAVRPRVDIAPEVTTAPLRLGPGAGRQVALLMMNLMPGTMVQRVFDADSGRAEVELHTLSGSLEPQAQWDRLQELVTPVFDEGLSRD